MIHKIVAIANVRRVWIAKIFLSHHFKCYLLVQDYPVEVLYTVRNPNESIPFNCCAFWGEVYNE